MINGTFIPYLVVSYILIIIFWNLYLKNKVRLSSYIKELISSLPILFIISLGFFFISDIRLWAIIITIILFLVSESQKRLEYWEKQEDILKQLNDELSYLTNEDGHIDYFRKCIIPKGYPHHNISKLNLNFYLTSLSSEINSENTLELKNKLKRANDKIKMLNDYRKDEVTWEKMMKHLGDTSYLNNILNELEERLIEIKKIITEKFYIKSKSPIPL